MRLDISPDLPKSLRRLYKDIPSLREAAAILRRSVEISSGIRSLDPELDGRLLLESLDP